MKVEPHRLVETEGSLSASELSAGTMRWSQAGKVKTQITMLTDHVRAHPPVRENGWKVMEHVVAQVTGSVGAMPGDPGRSAGDRRSNN